MKETAKVRRELTAFHEAGHCVAARVLGMQIEDEGCCILANAPFLGSTTINLDDLKSRPRDGMVTVIAGPVASVLREADLLKRFGVELSEEILSEVSHSTAEAMVPEVGGPEVDGEISADVDVINNLMAELIGHRCADTSKAVVAQVIALAIVGLDRKFINVRVETDHLAVSDEWYVPLREAVDRAIGVVREHRNMVDALATNLIEVGQMSGPEVIAFLATVDFLPERLHDNGPPLRLGHGRLSITRLSIIGVHLGLSTGTRNQAGNWRVWDTTALTHTKTRESAKLTS